jgi:hypothetical protein
MNRGVMAQRPFRFKPSSFTSEIPGLKIKTISQEKQLKYLDDFMEDPFRPVTYCVVSYPHDGQAKLFAAYLMQEACRRVTGTRSLPYWQDLTSGFDNELLDRHVSMSMLVLNNVGVNSTQAKLEKLRDTLEAYADRPRIVISTGCDPFVFFTQCLHLRLNACCYITGDLVRKTVEV